MEEQQEKKNQVNQWKQERQELDINIKPKDGELIKYLRLGLFKI